MKATADRALIGELARLPVAFPDLPCPHCDPATVPMREPQRCPSCVGTAWAYRPLCCESCDGLGWHYECEFCKDTGRVDEWDCTNCGAYFTAETQPVLEEVKGKVFYSCRPCAEEC